MGLAEFVFYKPTRQHSPVNIEQVGFSELDISEFFHIILLQVDRGCELSGLSSCGLLHVPRRCCLKELGKEHFLFLTVQRRRIVRNFPVRRRVGLDHRPVVSVLRCGIRIVDLF